MEIYVLGKVRPLANVEDLLRRVNLFRGLNDDQIARMARITKPESYARRAVIFAQHSAGDKMYVVGEGAVEVRIADADGSVQSALNLGAGQVFGEMALLDRGPRSASVLAAQDDTIVYAIRDTDFRALCENDTDLGYIIMRNIAVELSLKMRHQNFVSG